MSNRMMHRIDVVTTYGRWVALALVLLVAWLAPSSGRDDLAILGVIVGAMAVLNLVPAVLLAMGYFPRLLSLTFLVVDSLFALGLPLLGGSRVFFYSVLPAVVLSLRFDWRAGLFDTALLVIGYVLITLLQATSQSLGQAFSSIASESLVFAFASILAGVVGEQIKREPPLNAREVAARKKEMQMLRAAADRARAIYEMASTLSATLNCDRILDAVLEISTVGFDELDEQARFRERPAGVVFLYGLEGLYIAAARGLTYEEMDITLFGERGVLRRVLGSGDPVLLGNLADDAELRQFAAFRRCRSAMCVPLRAGFESYGAIVFASSIPGAFGPEHLELLSAVSNQAAMALTNAQLYQDLVKEKERIIEVEEEARTKLARDLHDGPTQSISAIAMRLNFVRLLLGRDPQKVKDELFKLENLARRTTKEIRTMLFTLRPVVLETQGLRAAIEQLAEKLQEVGDQIEIKVDVEDLEGRIDASIQAVAWFIAQEALNNVKKYARASYVEIRMYIDGDRFVTEIVDNGEGFDVEQVLSHYDERGSYGLRNLQERAELVNGRTTVESAPGQGTRITLAVPLSREAV